MKSKLLLFGLLFNISSVILGQENCQKTIDSLTSRINYLENSSRKNSSGRLVQAGLTTNLGMNFITPGQSKLIDKNGLGSCFSIGVTLNKAFKNSPTVGFTTGIEIGLEWYLGSENKLIKKSSIQGLYDYMKSGMDRKYLVRDVMYQWVYAQVLAPTDAKFAEDMVSWGKLLYFIEAALPEKEESIILRYSPEKFKWAEENEKRIWKYFVEQKLLFKNDELLKLGYFNEAPFTKGLPKESPDRLGQYIGWKMVRKYMEKNPELPLEKLVKVPFAQIMQAYKID